MPQKVVNVNILMMLIHLGEQTFHSLSKKLLELSTIQDGAIPL
jgi:hypothetical protein